MIDIVALTDIGNVRTVNQDYVRYYQKNDKECMVVLCDGMGGHNAGDIASKMTCDYIMEQYMNQVELKENEIQTWMVNVVNYASQAVKKKSYESSELEGMGTTVVVAIIKDDILYVCHVGDSRAYLFQDDTLVQLTKDDTLVNVLVDSGTISKDEAMNHPQKNILLQAVGVSDVLKVPFLVRNIENQLILICSDGLYNSLDDKQLVDILKQDKDLALLAEELIEEAKKFGGKDNIGFALIKNKGVVINESNQ